MKNINSLDFEKGYWQEPEPEPRFIVNKEYSNNSLLLAGCEETKELSDYKQRKIQNGWADILPYLDSVEMLWIAPKINQKIFDAISLMPNLRGLWLKHTSIKHIPSSGFQKLEYLYLGSSPSLSSITDLASISSLRWLFTENLKQITDFTEFSKLTNLEILGITGSTWTTQRIDTLKPLGSLSKLHYLSLVNARVLDNSLLPLHKLTNLKNLRIPLWWKKDEVLSLLNSNPIIKTGKIEKFS